MVMVEMASYNRDNQVKLGLPDELPMDALQAKIGKVIEYLREDRNLDHRARNAKLEIVIDMIDSKPELDRRDERQREELADLLDQ